MLLNRLWANDDQFKTLTFRPGLNLIVAERTSSSNIGDSRNGTGKSSFIRILRYLFGGGLAPELNSTYLHNHEFAAALSLPDGEGGEDLVTVTRRVSPTTRVAVTGWSVTGGERDLHFDEWRAYQAETLFSIPSDAARPTSSQLWGMLIRTHFGSPTKSHPQEADWETGVKLGHMLGLAPEVLSRAGELDALVKQRKAIRTAVREGAIRHLTVDEADLRAQLVRSRRLRDRTRESLVSFRVDEQYSQHQREADRLSGRIQALNDEALSLERRLRELKATLASEDEAGEDPGLQIRLAKVYAEMGVELPDRVLHRYEDVAAFHQSVVRNRQLFLSQEVTAVEARLDTIAVQRSILDEERAGLLVLLRNSVALDTFLSAQRSLAELESNTADLERRLATAAEINEIDTRISVATAETDAAVRAEYTDRTEFLDEAITSFNDLGAEIYVNRDARLLVSPGNRGVLQVKPQVSGDASDGIRSVEMYLLDMVCLIQAIKLERAPRLLVHDSHLFDAMDHRQVASCLNIGARLAEEHDFQYIVTMNSDFLESVEFQSRGSFDRKPYQLDVVLTDASEDGGLFGFRFE